MDWQQGCIFPPIKLFAHGGRDLAAQKKEAHAEASTGNQLLTLVAWGEILKPTLQCDPVATNTHKRTHNHGFTVHPWEL